jgi:integrase
MLAECITSVDEVNQSSLNPEQTELMALVLRPQPATRHNYALTFIRFVKGRIKPPGTAAAARTLWCGIEWGLRLNSCHPVQAIAEHWRSVLAQGEPNWEVECGQDVYDDISGQVSFQLWVMGRSSRRRGRLRLLPKGWLTWSLDLAATSSEQLRYALFLVALTGCRGHEVSSATFEFGDDDDLTLALTCAKPKGVNPLKRVRVLHFVAPVGEMALYHQEMTSWIRQTRTAAPFKRVKAKDIANLCVRISVKLDPELEHGLNPSAYRNAMVADLKRDGLKSSVIAYIVGHEDEETQQGYGVYSQGQGCRRDYLKLVAERNPEFHRDRDRERG